MRGRSLLFGMLLTLMPSPFSASASIKHRPTPVFDSGTVLWRAGDEVSKTTINPKDPFANGWLVGAEWPLVPGARPVALGAVERHQSFKNKAGAGYARLAEARIEGSKREQPVAISPSTLRIPTIQLLDCRALKEEGVCKGLMCTWEATGCHETTGNAAPTNAPLREEPHP
jgi:hypothetical protein